MTIPIFRLERIKHDKAKDRKDFIMDCVFIGVGVALLQVALTEKFTDGVKPLHKNKHRKNIAKIREVYDFLSDKRDIILARLSDDDLNTIQHKTSVSSRAFIQTVSLHDVDMSLELLAINILKEGIRRKRKTQIYREVKDFVSIFTLAKIYKNVKHSAGYDDTEEIKVAKDFVSQLRY